MFVFFRTQAAQSLGTEEELKTDEVVTQDVTHSLLTQQPHTTKPDLTFSIGQPHISDK